MYGGVVTVVILAAVAFPAFKFFYKAPTCFDGMMNGNERGMDCGGACEKLCSTDFFPPKVSWYRFEQIAPELYNIAAYVVNLNTDGEAKNVPYHMALYDDKGMLIIDLPGTMTIPPSRNTLAFRSAVSVGKRTPARVFFEFTGTPEWQRRSDTLSKLVVLNKEYKDEENGSSLMITLKNNDLRPIGRTTVYVALFDASGNALGFSKTILDEILPGQTVVAPYTWPVDRKGKVISIDVLPLAE